MEEENVLNTLIPGEKNPGQIPTDETAPIPDGGINPQGVPNTASGSPDTDIPHQGVNTAIIPDEEDLSGEGGDNFIEFIEVVKPDTVRPPDEKTRILNSAIEAQAKGDDLLAGILFDALAKMSNPNLHKVTKTLGQLSAEATIPDGLDHDGDLTYATTGTTHNFVGFTPYLDENIRKLRGPIPLTMFDKEWQELAMKHHLGKRAKAESSNGEKLVDYKGYGFIDEWEMTHSDWTTNHRNFHKTLINVYDITKFAALLLIHKGHCDNIIDEKGFMVAFRYDMQMRSNTFCHRIPVGGKSCIPDISQRKEHLVEHCYTVARNFQELRWKDNYYAPGHSHRHIDPVTGQPKHNFQQPKQNCFEFNPTNDPVHVFQNQGPWMFHNQAGSFSQPPQQAPSYQQQSHAPHRNNGGGGNQAGGESRKRSKGGYKGSNFINGYVDKRSSKGGDNGQANGNNTNR
ncbi:hypothetical protein PSTT_05469 [Puccinia striiformis]|uniref:Uncharacterized protein n=1 Tax=Puccinia striiformis TaxID=27350 RepID=A0A2S4VNY6_9BASI|nr:hypothetical protein PSTT_05469 [Puccinia striiformis]